MSEPLTIYVCDEGHVGGSLAANGCEECYGGTKPVRVFREEDVGPLWDAACEVTDVLYPAEEYGAARPLHDALEAFPAPEEWKS